MADVPARKCDCGDLANCKTCYERERKREQRRQKKATAAAAARVPDTTLVADTAPTVTAPAVPIPISAQPPTVAPDTMPGVGHGPSVGGPIFGLPTRPDVSSSGTVPAFELVPPESGTGTGTGDAAAAELADIAKRAESLDGVGLMIASTLAGLFNDYRVTCAKLGRPWPGLSEAPEHKGNVQRLNDFYGRACRQAVATLLPDTDIGGKWAPVAVVAGGQVGGYVLTARAAAAADVIDATGSEAKNENAAPPAPSPSTVMVSDAEKRKMGDAW